MAISTIPKITGPDYGGVIYGMNLQVGYSSEPSKLILDIISKDGNYDNIQLNKPQTVKFGNFTFNGIVWSYDINTTAEQKTLQITLVDNSIFLDRYYVLLWKRGMLNQLGVEKIEKKIFDFSDEPILTPRRDNTNVFLPNTLFKVETLGQETIDDIKIFENKSQIGNVILIGREKIPSSPCDIPDTYYTFNDLKDLLPKEINGVNLPNDDKMKYTHEGTLRQVLTNWSSDLGFDFYWDFSKNELVFYDVSKGIKLSPIDDKAKNLISFQESYSMEGTFEQYGIGYSAFPKVAIKTAPTNLPITLSYTSSPLGLGIIARKIGRAQKISDISRDTWGDGRNESEFLISAFLGYIDQRLRDLYCLNNNYYKVVGYNDVFPIGNVGIEFFSQIFPFEYQQMLDFCGGDDNNIECFLAIKNLGDAQKWTEFEKTLLGEQGKYYRIPDSSQTFFYCSPTLIAEIQVSIDPETSESEDGYFQEYFGYPLYQRNGSISYDSISASEDLGGDTELNKNLSKSLPIEIDLSNGNLGDLFSSKLEENNINFNDDPSAYTLVAHPKKNILEKNTGFKIDKLQLSFGVHPFEKTIFDTINSRTPIGRNNCQSYEENLEKNSCTTYEEKARDKAIKKKIPETDFGTFDAIGGLLNNSARTLRGLKLKNTTSNFEIYGPSIGSIQVVCRYDISITKLITEGTQQFIYSDGSPGTANDSAEIRINSENITDPNEDRFQSSRIPNNFYRPKDVKATEPSKKINYVFAGEPKGITLSPSVGLTSLDINFSSDGYKTSVSFSSRSPKPAKSDNFIRQAQAQFNRISFNSQ